MTVEPPRFCSLITELLSEEIRVSITMCEANHLLPMQLIPVFVSGAENAWPENEGPSNRNAASLCSSIQWAFVKSLYCNTNTILYEFYYTKYTKQYIFKNIIRRVSSIFRSRFCLFIFRSCICVSFIFFGPPFSDRAFSVLPFVNGLPDHAVNAESVRTCKSRLDKFTINQLITLSAQHI